MSDLEKLVSKALTDFRKVAVLADAQFIADSISVEIMPKPHQPKGLPTGKVSVYAFS